MDKLEEARKAAAEAYLRGGDPMRPYIVDAIDEAAAALYASRGFAPPERPNGFLNDGELQQWERWRDKAAKPAP